MPIESAGSRFGASGSRGEFERARKCRRVFAATKASFTLGRAIELLCIMLAITLGNIAVVKIVDALLDDLHY